MDKMQILGIIALVVAIVLMGSGLIIFKVYKKKLAEFNKEQSEYLHEQKKDKENNRGERR